MVLIEDVTHEPRGRPTERSASQDDTSIPYSRPGASRLRSSSVRALRRVISMPQIATKVTPWMTPAELGEFLEEGDLVEFQRDVFQHWGVYVERIDGICYVVHVSGVSEDGNTKAATLGSVQGLFASGQPGTNGEHLAEVQSTELHVAAHGRLCRVNNRCDAQFIPFPPEQVVSRAVSELGKRKYNLLTTNCEHFAKWCRYGTKSSSQASFVSSAALGILAGVASTSGAVGVAVAGATMAACHVGNRLRNTLLRDRNPDW